MAVGDWSDLHWRASQPVRSLIFCWQNVQEIPQIRGFLRVLQSLRFQDSNQNSQFRAKVSRVFLGNGRFAESKSGDWFDLPLSGEGDGIRTMKFHFFAQLNFGVVAERATSAQQMSSTWRAI